MNCQFIIKSEGVLYCPVCERTAKHRSPVDRHFRACRRPHERPEPIERQPQHGPGTELHRLLLECGISEDEDCRCRQRMAAMNRWGIAGCREHRETIIAWLKEAAAERGWGEKLRAGAAMARLWINPLAPYDSLLDEAIRRAELTQPAAPAV